MLDLQNLALKVASGHHAIEVAILAVKGLQAAKNSKLMAGAVSRLAPAGMLFGLSIGTAIAALTATIVGIAAIGGLLAVAYGAVSKGKGMASAETGGIVKESGMAQIHKDEAISGTKNEMGFGGNKETINLLKLSLVEAKRLRADQQTLMIALQGKISELSLRT